MCTDIAAQAEQLEKDQKIKRERPISSFKAMREEVKRRKEIMAAKGLKDRVVLLINEDCFDVTDYHKEHPGNSSVQNGKLPPWNLQDVSDYYDKYHCDGGSVADEMLAQAKQGIHPKIKYLGFSREFFRLACSRDGVGPGAVASIKTGAIARADVDASVVVSTLHGADVGAGAVTHAYAATADAITHVAGPAAVTSNKINVRNVSAKSINEVPKAGAAEMNLDSRKIANSISLSEKLYSDYLGIAVTGKCTIL